MDFDFTDNQEQLRDAVRRWVAKAYGFERRRAIAAAGGFDRAVLGELAELGLTALTVPEAQGGLGQGAVDAMVVMEELGRGLVLAPLAQTLIVAEVLARHAPRPCRPHGCRASPMATRSWCWRSRSARRATGSTFVMRKRFKHSQDMR